MTMDLTSLIPVLISFFVIAGIGLLLALSTIVMLATESRRRPHTVANTPETSADVAAVVATSRAA